MRRIHWWMLCGVPVAGLLAALLGPSVLGQPDVKTPVLLPSAPLVVVGPDVPADTPKAPELQLGQVPEFPPGLPIPKPVAPPPVPFKNGLPAPPDKFERPLASVAQAPGVPLSLNVAPGRQQPALAIEWSSPPAVRVNQPLAAQILIKNTSATPAQNVVVRHRLGQGVTCKASEPMAVNDAGELVWHLGTMAPEQSRRIDLQLVSQNRGVLDCHASVTFTAVAAHQIQVREPQLIVKVRVPDRVIVGENVTLLFAISNPGDGATESVKLKTLLPDGLEHPRGKVIEFDVGNLAPKEIRTMQLVCQAKGQGTQKCMVVASGEGNLSANDHCQFDILMPKLDVAMSGPKLRYLDRHAVYVLKVTNLGSAAANNVELQELIPAGFKFHHADHGGQFQEGTRLVSWTLGDLQPGQTKNVAVDLVPIETGEHRLIAHAKALRGLKSAAEVRTVVEGLPSLAIEVGQVDDPIEIGAETAFEVRLVNAGTKTESNVQVVCTLPEELEFKGAKCSTALRYDLKGRELIFEPLARLAPKADVIYRVQVRGIAAGDARFRMRISADGLKVPVLREQSMRIYSDDALSTPAVAPASVPPLPSPGLPNSVPLPAPASKASPVAPAPAPPISTPIPDVRRIHEISIPPVPPPSLIPRPLPVPPGK